MDAINAAQVDLSKTDDLVHGSTVATNAILERKGARVCLFVTEGTRDLLHIQRHDRRHIYDLYYRKPEPIVQRRDTFEIRERVDAAGHVVIGATEQEVEQTVRAALGSHTFGSVAICLLNSYANPDHERMVAAAVRRLYPNVTVTCSVDVCREFREYERCSTTALAAYVQPVIDGYLKRFDTALRDAGYNGRFSVMQSNGGRLPADAMGENAITSLFSGPAAGVTGATRQAARSGFRDIITLDMGGTSTDVCLVENSQPLLAGNTTIDGLPIKTPIIDIATVGAGGGSIAWIDDGDLLRVGPQSAGADPGPACYGRGGDLATVTDAHVIRGTVRPESFLDGRMPLDTQAAHRVFEPLAKRLGVSVEEAADAAIQVAESNIVRAIQRISTEKGKDPRDYALVAFGGAGPMQAVRVAEELAISTVLVPPHAGVLSAYGLLAADFIHYETRTHRVPVDDASMEVFRGTLDELKRSVGEYLAGLGLANAPKFTVSLDMRYTSQAFEIPVALDIDEIGAMSASGLRERFDAAHRAVFEFDEGAHQMSEIVSFRVGGAVAPHAQPTLTANANANSGASEQVSVYDRGHWISCERATRAVLAGRPNGTDGTALVEDGTSTLYIPHGWSATVDDAHNILLSRL
jgi:N-methylhydantoinase A